jgi:dipeptidyl aminopeptidase/acylaminoacyl peptidase
MLRIRLCFATLFLVALGAGLAHGDDRSRTRAVVDTFLSQIQRVHYFKETAISPDGHRVAWVQGVRDAKGQPAWGTAIYVKDLANPNDAPIHISADPSGAAHDESGISWSPDSQSLLFLSNVAREDQHQVYAAPVTGQGVKQLTQAKGVVADAHYSPDGKQVAFLLTEGTNRAAGPLQAGAAQTGVIGDEIHEQRLAVVNVETGELRRLSPADLHVYEYDWSPDNQRLVAIAAHGSGDNNWYVAEIYTIDAGSGQTKSILKPDMQIAIPRWSPDGKAIAYIGGLMSDEGFIGGDVYYLRATGEDKPTKLTPDLKASVAYLAWNADGKHITLSEHADGGSAIASLDMQTSKVEELWKGSESVWSFGWALAVSSSSDGKTFSLIRSSFDLAPEVWAGPIGKWEAVTHANERLQRGWGDVKNLHWKSDDFTVQGWLMYPLNFDPSKRYPLIVHIHGGPAGALQPRWPSSFFDGCALSAADYFVLYPNPRGSYGQGEKFTRANVKDFGYGDFRDIMAGVDAVLKTEPIDPNRLGVTGWSYGGYMTMWAVTQTDRFHAAVVGAGLSNWQSYYGQNGIDQWMIPYFGASVYDDPAVYAKSSPINFIKRVKTPSLILVGERDVECPPPQSFEFWHALKTFNVPTQLVVYPNEGHAIAQPEHHRDILVRSLDWFEKYLRAKPGVDSSQ